MNEPVNKPTWQIAYYIKRIGAFGILIVCFMAGFGISYSLQSSEVSKLRNECDRKEKAHNVTIDQFNVMTSAFEKYRRQYPGLNDGQLIEDNNKLRKDIQILMSQIATLKDDIKDARQQNLELSKTNENLVNEKNKFQSLVNNKDKEMDNLKQKIDQALIANKKLEDKLKNYKPPTTSTAKATKKKKADRVLAEDEYICDTCGEIHKKYPFDKY